MLGILLLILKIIGWILLGCVCLIFALLLLILFVPVPYRFQAEFGDGFTYRLKIFGLQVVPKKEKPGRKKRRRRKRKAGAEDEPSKEEPSKEEPSKEESSKDKPSEDEPSGDETTGAGGGGQEQSVGVPDGPNVKELLDEPEKDSAKRDGFRKAKTKKRDGKKTPKKKKFKNNKFGKNKSGKKKSDKKKSGKKKSEKKKRETKGMDMDALRQKWELLRAEFTDDGNRRALGHGVSEMAYVLRHCGPRRVKADVAYSLADPASTGYVTALLSICPFVYGKGCGMNPDFESEKLYARGWVDVRGHVRLVHFGLSGLRLLIDRDIRAIIRKVRR